MRLFGKSTKRTLCSLLLVSGLANCFVPVSAEKAVLLKTPPDLPFIPPFPGTPKYTSMAAFHNQSGPSYLLTFQCQEDQTAVVQWYQQVLSKYSWRVTGASAQASNFMSARHGKDMVVAIEVSQSAMKGYVSQVFISFKIFS